MLHAIRISTRRSFSALALLALSAGAGPAWAATKGDSTLFEGWYTVTIGKSMRYGYYHDRASVEGGNLHYLNEYWKNDEGFINEEKLGTVSKNDDSLRPVFFNFRSKFRSNETNIDGKVDDALRLSVTKRTGDGKAVPKSVGLTKDTVFSTQFPVWLARQLPKMKPGKAVTFKALLEDGGKDFQPVDAKATLEPFDDVARETKTQKVSVLLAGQPSTWYVEPSGRPVRILFTPPQLEKTEVRLVSEKEAKNFLGE